MLIQTKYKILIHTRYTIRLTMMSSTCLLIYCYGFCTYIAFNKHFFSQNVYFCKSFLLQVMKMPQLGWRKKSKSSQYGTFPIVAKLCKNDSNRTGKLTKIKSSQLCRTTFWIFTQMPHANYAFKDTWSRGPPPPLPKKVK